MLPKRIIIAFCVLSFLSYGRLNAQEYEITSDFPGGNILVDSIVNDTIYLMPDQRDTDHTKEYWFYWYFGVKGAEGKRLHFKFNTPHVITSKGPAISFDKGKNWSWMYPNDSVDIHEFSFSMPLKFEEVRFSMGLPYTAKHFYAFYDTIKNSRYVTMDNLCNTRGNRETEWLKIRDEHAKPAYFLLLTARHHACEMTASYVLEGMLLELVEQMKHNTWVRDHIECMAFPFMDKDGVEAGDQGKRRKPHDHNRDYVQYIYCSTRKLGQNINRWSNNQTMVSFDLHCPWIKYGWNDRIFFVGSFDEEVEKEQHVFIDLLAENSTGPLKTDPGNTLFPHGKGWNSSTYEENLKDRLMSCSKWSAAKRNTLLASTIEVAYASHIGVPLYPENLRAYGKDVIKTLIKYLQEQ